MANVSTEQNERSIIALVACDASYKPLANFTPDELLAVYPDSAQKDEAPLPESFVGKGLENWKFVRDERTLGFARPGTGFSVVLFENDAKRESVVALTGTNGPDAQDWWTNLNLGMTQWNMIHLPDLLWYQLPLGNSLWGRTVHFTGQSLGGALAQYAAHDFARALDSADQFRPDRVTLTTFNGIGCF